MRIYLTKLLHRYNILRWAAIIDIIDMIDIVHVFAATFFAADLENLKSWNSLISRE